MNKKHPNTAPSTHTATVRNGEQGKFIANTVLALGGVVLAAVGGSKMVDVVRANHLQDQLTSDHVLKDFKNNEISRDKVVVVKVTDAGNGNPDSLAIRIDSKEAEDKGQMKRLSAEIAAQADAQGYPGVEQGETYVLDARLVDNTAHDGIQFEQFPPNHK
jgi:hypothetical protein